MTVAAAISTLDRPRYDLRKILRANDYDRYLTTIFAPVARMDGLLAIYAFNAEVAKTAQVVSEPMLGHIRLQWWREVIDQIYTDQGTRDHEVAGPLAAAIKKYYLTRDYFDAIIDAREIDLNENPFASMEDFLRYLESSSSNLVYLALEVLGYPHKHERAVGREVGIAYALTGVLRALPYNARHSRVMQPDDLIGRYELRKQDIIDRTAPDKIRDLVREIHHNAVRKLEKARTIKGQTHRGAVAAFLPGTIAEMYLHRMEKAGFDIFDKSILRPPSLARLITRNLIGQF